ncbi:TIR-like protein FxsC [Streptomyces sp. NPDC060022]|uniref:TIR-like protein FxsC n=1 Tax=Streptomyces sp. NPDC060022 TaxID=3347039 RepID=UPI0036D0A8E7
MTELPEPFGRLGVLAAQLGMTAEELADAVLLAAAGFEGDAAGPEFPMNDTSPDIVPSRSQQQDSSPAEEPTRGQPTTGGHQISAYGPANGESRPGVRLTLGQAAALPQALAIGRALRPLRRRWQHGHQRELNIDATVEDYARTGLLLPHLVPMPERWLDVTIVLDRSSSMSVWDPAVAGLNKVLRSLGALRTLNTWHLNWSGTDPVIHDQRDAHVPADQAGRREGQPGRRLMLILSDCAAPGWRSSTLWKHLHTWSQTTSLAIFNPLPPRLWHRTALDLPLTITTAPEPVAPSASWRYEPKQPRRWRRESSIRSWNAVPVIGTDPEDLRRWAQTLMRSDPEGCTAVLIPDTGRPPQQAPRRPSARSATPAPKPGARAEAFLQTARTPATQLAIHAAALDTFTLPILHALREQAVPEARLDDLAELLTADLCTVRRNPEADDLYTFRPEALTHLRRKLTRQTAWRTHQALTRHIASRPWTPDGLTAVLHTATGSHLPTALVPFAEAADSVLRQLGVIIPTATLSTPSTSPSPEPTSSLVSALEERLFRALNVPLQDWPIKIQLLESLTADCVRLLGDRHPDTLTARSNLATSYYQAGRTEEAIAIERRVLADSEEILGERHPDTLTARANLATSYRQVGRIEEAIAIERRVLADREEILGDRHPDTLTARANLATSYRQVGRIEEAIAIERRVLADREEILGDRHPDTLTARANLATSYRQVGRIEEAIAIERRVLADREETLGDRHPDTLTARANLATSYYQAGRTEEAIAIERRVLADREEILGDRHPHTLTARSSLATSYYQAGRTEEAIAIRQRVLADSEEILGDHHPDTLDEVSVGVLPALGTAETSVELVSDPGVEAVGNPEDAAPSAPGLRRARTHRGVSPYFFLSYAHTPGHVGETAPDRWVERFFQDLCDHVMALTDLPVGTPVGFMDRQIQSGEIWSERLSEMLANCRVFVPLFSPRYFASVWCGKEWYGFEQRAIHHRARSNQPAEAVVPAIWVPVPPSQLPVAAERLQFNHRSFGDSYISDGLYGLIQLKGYAEEYERAVYELAKRIVSVADTVQLAPGTPLDYRTFPSAFGSPSNESGDRRPIQITVVAPTRRNLPEGRNPESYGNIAQDWNPYYPASTRPLAQVAEALLRSLNYRSVISSFDMESGRSGGKRRPDTPEILLIDRWALQDESRRRRLAAIDAEDQPWATVVVPWNRHDGQSQAAEAELTEKLEQTLPIKMRQGRALARAAARGVPTMEAFGQVLPQVVEVAVQQYLRHATANPPAD